MSRFNYEGINNVERDASGQIEFNRRKNVEQDQRLDTISSQLNELLNQSPAGFLPRVYYGLTRGTQTYRFAKDDILSIELTGNVGDAFEFVSPIETSSYISAVGIKIDVAQVKIIIQGDYNQSVTNFSVINMRTGNEESVSLVAPVYLQNASYLGDYPAQDNQNKQITVLKDLEANEHDVVFASIDYSGDEVYNWVKIGKYTDGIDGKSIYSVSSSTETTVFNALKVGDSFIVASTFTHEGISFDVVGDVYVVNGLNPLSITKTGNIRGPQGIQGQTGATGQDGQDGATPYIQDDYWYINGVDTGVKAIGTDGTNGVDGISFAMQSGLYSVPTNYGESGNIGPNSEILQQLPTLPQSNITGKGYVVYDPLTTPLEPFYDLYFANNGDESWTIIHPYSGIKGQDGTDGYTPYIQNNQWYINGVSTGVQATGNTGPQGPQGPTGLGWFISSSNILSDTSTIPANTVTVPSGYSLSIGDIILGQNFGFGRITAISGDYATLTLSYISKLQGDPTLNLNIVNGEGSNSVKLNGNKSKGAYSAAMGNNNIVQADRALANGGGNVIRYDSSNPTSVNGYMGLASGQNNYVSGWGAAAIGSQLEAKNSGQFITGSANKYKTDTYFEVGNGKIAFVNVDSKPSWQDILENPIYYRQMGDGYTKITENNTTQEQYENLTISEIYQFDDSGRSNAFEVKRNGSISLGTNSDRVFEDLKTYAIAFVINQVAPQYPIDTLMAYGYDTLKTNYGTQVVQALSYQFQQVFTSCDEAIAYLINYTLGITYVDNEIKAPLSAAFGIKNVIYSLAAIANGYNNKIGKADAPQKGTASGIIGVNNEVYGENDFVVGDGNKIEDATRSATFGNGNIVKNSQGFDIHDAYGFGQGLKVEETHQTAVGRYNDATVSATAKLFEVGNGTADNARSNAFEVMEDGVARAYGTPSGNNDLTPKQYVDNNYAKKDASNLSSTNVNSWNSTLGASQLVVDYSLTADGNALNITGLDLSSDGGVYDIILDAKSTSGLVTVYGRVNNLNTDKYFFQKFSSYNTTGENSQTKDNIDFTMGLVASNPSTIRGTMHLGLSNMPKFNFWADSVQDFCQQNFFAGGFYVANTNVTSLYIWSTGTFASGTRIRIYKRATNTQAQS